MAPFFQTPIIPAPTSLRFIFYSLYSCSIGALQISIYSNSVKWEGDFTFIDCCHFSTLSQLNEKERDPQKSNPSYCIHFFFSITVFCLDTNHCTKNIDWLFICNLCNHWLLHVLSNYGASNSIRIVMKVLIAFVCDCENFVGKTMPRSIFG